MVQEDLCQICLVFALALISKCLFLTVREQCVELLVGSQTAAILACTRSGIVGSSGYVLQISHFVVSFFLYYMFHYLSSFGIHIVI